MKTFFAIMLGALMALPASATTYFMRADGTAASKAAATSCSSASTAMSVATHNSQTFSAGDVITLCDSGGTFKGILIPPSNGSAGNPITYTASGSPIIDGRDVFSSWTTFNAVWTPASATTVGGQLPCAWFKADSLMQSNGTAVTSWADSSGNGHTATQATGANQPTFETNQINGLPAISFNSAGPNFLNIASPLTLSNATIFVVYETNFQSGSWLGGSSSTGGLQDFINGSGHQELQGSFDGSIGTGTASTLNNNNWYQVAATWQNATACAFYLFNGTSTVSDGTCSSATNISGTTAVIGSDHGGTNASFTGLIEEIPIYCSALVSADILQVQGYIHTRTGK